MLISFKNGFKVDIIDREMRNATTPYRLREDVKILSLPTKYRVWLLRTSLRVKNQKKIRFKGKNKLFQKLLQKHSHYLWHSDKRHHILVVCWILATYLYPMFQLFPILAFTGLRRSGKGTNLTFIDKSAWNTTGSLITPTKASLGRQAMWLRPTFIIDEMDYMSRSEEYSAVRALIESCFEKGRAISIVNTETGDIQKFETFAPCAYASRNIMFIEDKVIPVLMEETKDIRYGKRRSDLDTDADFNEIVGECIKFALIHHREVLREYENIEPTSLLYGRDYQLWRPILAVAKVVCPEYYNDLFQLSTEIAETKKEETLVGSVELCLLRMLVQKGEMLNEPIYLKDLAKEVRVDMPWIKGWQGVHSAIRNLKITKRSKTDSRGKKYWFDFKRVQEKAVERGVSMEKEETTLEEVIRRVVMVMSETKTQSLTDEELRETVAELSLSESDTMKYVDYLKREVLVQNPEGDWELYKRKR